MDTISLAGARVLVVGASSGIGRAVAVGAVRDGARVVMAARRSDHLEKARAEADGGWCVSVDLTDPGSGAVTVGATFPTDFATAFDGELLTRLMTDWSARGLDQEEYLTPEGVAAVLLGTAATAWRLPGVCVEHLTVRSAWPVTGTSAHTFSPSERPGPAPARPASDSSEQELA